MVLTTSDGAALDSSNKELQAQAQVKTKMQPYRYVTEEGVKHILDYRYSGSDASLLYNHVISPSAQWLVNHVLSPRLAPNAITIGALSLVILSHVIMLW